MKEDLQQGYTLRFSKMAGYRTAIWKVLIDHYFQKRIGEDQVVLDLGSGWGEFINNIQAKKKFAMDLNPDGGKRVDDDVVFLEQDCSMEWEIPDNALDVVFTSNFFEHLPTKASLLDTLRQAHRCLRAGGRIICMGPNIRYLGGAYWDFFDHYLELSHLSLEEGLKLAGFEIKSSIPRFLPYTMADGKRPPLFALKLYVQFPLFWRLFGKQFLLTATKPANDPVREKV